MIKMSFLRQVNVPKYDELSVTNLFPKVKENDLFMRYLPDRLPKDKLPDRVYFFNVMNTVFPEYTQNMIDHANALRFKSDQAEDRMEQIKVTDQMWDELQAMPFFSSKLHFP